MSDASQLVRAEWTAIRRSWIAIAGLVLLGLALVGQVLAVVGFLVGHGDPIAMALILSASMLAIGIGFAGFCVAEGLCQGNLGAAPAQPAKP